MEVATLYDACPDLKLIGTCRSVDVMIEKIVLYPALWHRRIGCLPVT